MISGRLQRGKRARYGGVAALLSILMTAGPASWITISVAAETVAGSWDVAQLMQERRGVSQARARFTEERRSDLFEEPLMLSGTLRYDAPARVEKRIDVPFEERYVVDGDALRLERRGKRPRKASLQDHPLLWTFVEGFRATLAGNLETLQRFYTIDLQGDRQHWRLVLVPRYEEMKALVRSIEFQGSHADITHIEILERGGDSSRMTLGSDRS